MYQSVVNNLYAFVTLRIRLSRLAEIPAYALPLSLHLNEIGNIY